MTGKPAGARPNREDAYLQELIAQAYAVADEWADRAHRARWVMDLSSYKHVRAACEVLTGRQTDPETWVPDPADMLAGIYIEVREDGGEPHLEPPP